MDSKGKKNSNPKNPPYQKRVKYKSHEESSGSKKNSQKKNGKGEMSKCAYCGKGFHPESSFMKKKIDMLNQLLEKHNISIPKCTKKKEGG